MTYFDYYGNRCKLVLNKIKKNTIKFFKNYYEEVLLILSFIVFDSALLIYKSPFYAMIAISMQLFVSAISLIVINYRKG